MIVQQNDRVPFTVTFETKNELKIFFGLLNMNEFGSWDGYMKKRGHDTKKAQKLRYKMFTQLHDFFGELDEEGLDNEDA